VYKDPDTVAAGLSHDHVMVASGWSGTVRWDPADPASCMVEVRVPVSGLQVDPAAWRTRVGYDTTLDDAQRAQIRDHMLSGDQLDAGHHTDMRFVASSCAVSGTKVKVTGTLTIRGVAVTVSPTLALQADATSFSAAGSLAIKATSFGFSPYTAMLGALKNRDDMKLTLDLHGAP